MSAVPAVKFDDTLLENGRRLYGAISRGLDSTLAQVAAGVFIVNDLSYSYKHENCRLSSYSGCIEDVSFFDPVGQLRCKIDARNHCNSSVSYLNISLPGVLFGATIAAYGVHQAKKYLDHMILGDQK